MDCDELYARVVRLGDGRMVTAHVFAHGGPPEVAIAVDLPLGNEVVRGRTGAPPSHWRRAPS